MDRTPEAREADANVIARYDRRAEPYRDLWAPILRSAAIPLVRRLRGDGVERVLDVATGVGRVLQDLADEFPDAAVVGVDRSRAMLSLAPTAFPRAVMDARELAIRSQAVDRVFLLFVLFHLDDPVAALREARRVLRDGGRVGTITWGRELESKAFAVWSACLEEFGAPPEPGFSASEEAVRTPERVDALLGAAGFELRSAWEAEFVVPIDVERLVRIRTSLGSSKTRLDEMPPDRAAACVNEARERLRSLEPEDFVARTDLVYAIGAV